MSNANLNAAKKAKNDEFYTMYEDIENELQHYPGAFQGKIVYCNCDNPEWSNFWKYFHENFAALGLKKLVSTHYEKDVEANGHPYKMEYDGGNDADITVGVKTSLKGNGDFASDECIEILQQADIVVTNPPFSQFRLIITLIMRNKKGFIIWGTNNAIGYKDIFPYLKNNKVWIGHIANKTCRFRVPEDYEKYDEKETEKINDGHKYCSVNAISVFTNLDLKKRHEGLVLRKKYDSNIYSTYDNYRAINVDRCKDIPYDYCESWGVTAEELSMLPDGQWETTRKEGNLFFVIPAKGTELRRALSEHTADYKIKIEEELTRYIKKKDTTAALLGYPVPFSADTAESNSDSLGTTTTSTETAEKGFPRGNLKQPEVENTKELLYKRYCNGIIGVPITYIYKHNPEQFSIVNANDYRKTESVPVKPHGLIKDKEAAVKKNCVCQNMHQKKNMTYWRREIATYTSEERSSMAEFLSERYCNGIIGAPITYLTKHNPEQFIIIGLGNGNINGNEPECYIRGFNDKGGAPLIGKRFAYARILIRRKI